MAIVSDPLPDASPASSARSSAHLRSGVSLAAAGASVETDVAYISLPPHTYPDGATAVISNPRLGVAVTAPIIDGGLDPVPVPASAGDIMEIEILLASGASAALLSETVPARRRPRVVRTVPPRGKTDVPLNSRIVIVFSEPVDAASLSPSSVQLFRGASAVPGTVRSVAGVTAAVVFEASTDLDANTEYRLVVTNTVRDLDGDALDATTVSFTTGTTREGPVASLSLIPEAAGVRIGTRFQLIATARDAQGTILAGRPIRWTSSNRAVATVSGTGLVTAVAEGYSIIMAQVEGWFVAMVVVVSESMVPAASVTLTVDSASVTPGGTLELAVEARDAQGSLIEDRLVAWTSSNPSVAAVAPSAGERALVTGVADGVARIVATIEGKSDTAVVTVGPPSSIVGLIISPDNATLLLRATTRLSGLSRNAAGGRTAIVPDQIAWASSDPTVASVDNVGLVTGAGTGSTTITATWNGFTSTARVTVVGVAFEALSAGRSHTCGVTSSGAAYCWGGNDFGQAGKPGLVMGGLIDPFARPTKIRFPVPVRVAEELTFVGVSAGAWHTCGISAGGAAHCWGYNGEGALGNGTFANSWRPVPVAGGHAFAALDAGSRHTCGLTAEGAAYCWGANRGGELGNGTFVGSATPVAVAVGLTFVAISVGESHTCGLTPAGVAYCWGRNSSGQLGVGDAVPGSATPLAVAGGLTFTALDAGAAHTCGVTTSGIAYCWGWNFDGQLGNGAPYTPSATPVAVAGGLSLITISAGRSHTCGVDASAAAYCWGQNLSGRLGTGTITAGIFAIPQPVAGGVSFARLTVGAEHTCALAANSGWHCWGENETGALGIGTTTDSGMPVKVLGQR